MRLLVPVSRVTTAWTRLPDVVSTVRDDLGLWQVCGRRDPFAWVGAVLSWTEHRVALLAQMLGPEIYDKCLLGATRLPRYSLAETRGYHQVIPCLHRQTTQGAKSQCGDTLTGLPLWPGNSDGSGVGTALRLPPPGDEARRCPCPSAAPVTLL